VEKGQLAEEATGLGTARKDIEDLKAKVESLDKALTSSKAAKELALVWLQKANDAAEGLCIEMDAEKSSSATLIALVELLTKRFDDAKAIGLSTTELYINAMAGFGGITSSLPVDACAFGTFSWMKTNFSKLPNFVAQVGDFAVLSSATNLSKGLAKAGCPHIEDLKKKKKELESLAKLGDSSRVISKAVKNFISNFWCKFGEQDARALAEAHRAEVCLL
jgi:hypothetical protein